MSKERPENKLIRKNSSKITTLICDSKLEDWFTFRLAEEAFIAHAQQYSVLGIRSFTRVTRMLGAVESRLKTTDTPEETLKRFIQILQESQGLKDLARELIAQYGK